MLLQEYKKTLVWFTTLSAFSALFPDQSTTTIAAVPDSAFAYFFVNSLPSLRLQIFSYFFVGFCAKYWCYEKLFLLFHRCLSSTRTPQSFILKAFSITPHNAKIINISLWLNEILNLWKMSSFESNASAIRIYSGGGGSVWRLGSRLEKAPSCAFTWTESRLPGSNLRINLRKINFQFRRWNLRRGLDERKIPRHRRHLSTAPHRVKGF